MSARRLFLRNVAMALAVSLVPKILRPAEPEVMEDELMPAQLNMFVRAPEGYEYMGEKTIWIPKKDYEALIKITEQDRSEKESQLIWGTIL